MKNLSTDTPTAHQPFVSIIVPTFRRSDVLRETLQALLLVDYPCDRHEIIVVDDGSKDNTQEVVAELQRECSHIRYHAQENRGVAGTRNQGARLASGEVFIFLDDDMIIPPTLIKRHVESLEYFGRCVICGYREFDPRLTHILQQTPFGRFRIRMEAILDGWDLSRKPTNSVGEDCVESPGRVVTGNNLAVRRKDFFEIGGYDEEFPYAGYEEQEFSYRARKAGFRCLVNYGIKAWNNDRRLTLQEWCERQKRGAITATLIAVKYPDIWMHQPLIRENRSIQSGDPPALIIKKSMKRLLATHGSLNVLYRVIAVSERRWPNSKLLPRLYTLVCGLYIFRGIRVGLARYSHSYTKPHEVKWVTETNNS